MKASRWPCPRCIPHCKGLTFSEPPPLPFALRFILTPILPLPVPCFAPSVPLYTSPPRPLQCAAKRQLPALEPAAFCLQEELKATMELYERRAASAGVPIVVFNGELDRIRGGYYPSLFFPALAKASQHMGGTCAVHVMI